MGGTDVFADDVVIMDLLEIKDWHVLQRQPAEVVDYWLELLEKRGQFQAEQADRASKGPRMAVSKTPPPDIQRSD